MGKPQDEAYYDEYKTILVKVVNKPDLPIVYNVKFWTCCSKMCFAVWRYGGSGYEEEKAFNKWTE